MARAEFDEFAARYRSLHASNIAITGEAPEYFAEYKMRDFAGIVSNRAAPADGHYLDYGSGVGASILPFKTHMPQARLTCADVSGESLDNSRAAHGELASYLHMDNDGRIGMADSTIDGAFACCVFHHIPHSEHIHALAELRRVMKPGAPLMIYEHNPLNPLTVHAVNTCPLDDNAVLITAGTMRRRVLQAGFRDARVNFRVFFPASLSRLRKFESRLRWLPLGAQYFVSAIA